MAGSKRELQQREMAAMGLQDEVATLREAVERAEQETDVRAADIARLASELSGLRETVMRAQRDAEQSAAAAKLLKSELAAAESALMAARQVGRAAINGLAIGEPAPLDPLPQLRSRQTLRRWFGFAGGA
jgi:chromosome segregation ATPase